MKKIVVLLCIALSAQAESMGSLQVSGYAQNTLSVLADNVGRLSEQVRLRTEGEWNLGDKAGLEVQMVFGATWQPLDPFVNMRDGSLMAGLAERYMGGAMASLDSATQVMVGSIVASSGTRGLLTYLPYTSLYPTESVALDRVLIKLYFKKLDLFIGKQMVAWGTGYAFNPTDIWNQKNPLDPTAPRQGVFALRSEIPLGDISGISLVLALGADLHHSSGGVRLKANLGGYDIAACAMKVMTADRVLYGAPPLVMVGFDMAGNVGDVGVWVEAVGVNPKYDSLAYTDTDEAYVQATTGTDYTLRNGLYLMGEYFFNGLGKDDYLNYDVASLIHLTQGDMPGLGMHYLMLGTSYEVVMETSVSLFSLINVIDGSAMLLPGIEYAFSPDAIINLNGQISVGDAQKSEYGSVYHSVLMKVIGYF